jgi:hypothetical protein
VKGYKLVLLLGIVIVAAASVVQRGHLLQAAAKPPVKVEAWERADLPERVRVHSENMANIVEWLLSLSARDRHANLLRGRLKPESGPGVDWALVKVDNGMEFRTVEDDTSVEEILRVTDDKHWVLKRNGQILAEEDLERAPE